MATKKKNNTEEENLALIRDAFIYRNKLAALFEGMDDVMAPDFNKEDRCITIKTWSNSKYELLKRMIKTPVKLDSGTIDIVISNECGDGVNEKDVAELFANSPWFDDLIYSKDSPKNYVIFAKKIVQYFDDDFSQFYGHQSTTAEALCRELLHAEQCCLSTSLFDPDDLFMDFDDDDDDDEIECCPYCDGACGCLEDDDDFDF